MKNDENEDNTFVVNGYAETHTMRINEERPEVDL